MKNNKTIIKDTRSTSGDGLWDILIPRITNISKKIITNNPFSKVMYPKPAQNSLNIILRTDERASELAAYSHAASFSPVKYTFLNAIKQNFFLIWSGLTYSLIQNHLVVPQSIILRHIKQNQHSLCSTETEHIQKMFTQNQMR